MLGEDAAVSPSAAAEAAAGDCRGWGVGLPLPAAALAAPLGFPAALQATSAHVVPGLGKNSLQRLHLATCLSQNTQLPLHELQATQGLDMSLLPASCPATRGAYTEVQTKFEDEWSQISPPTAQHRNAADKAAPKLRGGLAEETKIGLGSYMTGSS